MQVLIRAGTCTRQPYVENAGVAAPIMRGTDHARNHNPLSPCLSGIELDPSIKPGARRYRPRGSCQVQGRMCLMRESRNTPNHRHMYARLGLCFRRNPSESSPLLARQRKRKDKKRKALRSTRVNTKVPSFTARERSPPVQRNAKNSAL